MPRPRNRAASVPDDVRQRDAQLARGGPVARPAAGRVLRAPTRSCCLRGAKAGAPSGSQRAPPPVRGPSSNLGAITAPGPHALVARSEELARLDAALEAARSGAGVTVAVHGQAGIGKSSLVAAARERAAAAGMRILSSRGSPLEQDYAMGIVRQCFERVLRTHPERKDLLSGAARLAETAVLELTDDVVDVPPVGVLHGLYWLTANLAGRAPVLLVVDDAHWADEPSLRFLAYLARRVESLPVTLLIGSRNDEDTGAGNAGRDLPRAGDRRARAVAAAAERCGDAAKSPRVARTAAEPLASAGALHAGRPRPRAGPVARACYPIVRHANAM
ncbi:MAG TPA: ATP-binding protein [Solirubrobacteraceae bacterium]|nr:ATP-binding protein [Solirubrobacteraceae bacterium]